MSYKLSNHKKAFKKEARILNDMSKTNKYPKIAIDGPAGAGKSTVTREVSRRLELKHLDTGAMYRAIALKFYREKAELTDLGALEEIVKRTSIEFGDKQKVFLDEEDVTEEIRQAHINEMVSTVSAVSLVRAHLVELQKKIAGESKGIVMEGRDIGSRVMPDADFKFYLDASIDERTRRRRIEQEEKGLSLTEEEVIAEIKNRDNIDSMRKDSPLTRVDDAILIDTTGMTFEEVVDSIEETVTRRLR